MKKMLSILVAAVVALSMFTFNVGAVNTDPTTVGAITGETQMAPGFSSDKATLAKVRKLIMQEYNRGVKTRSIKHKGKALFNYGESTGELVHPWVGSQQTTGDGEVREARSCMNQDFTGGFSDSLATLGQGDNWCCILVTPESLAKGEAYTVRDGIANAWGNAGATNSFWGLPTGNQYWIGDTCYQTFEYGYAAAEKAQVINVEFLAYNDGNVAPAPGDYDHYTEVPLENGNVNTVDPDAVNEGDGNVVDYRPEDHQNGGNGEEQPGEEQGGEEQAPQDGQPQDGENQPGEEQGGDNATGEVSSKAGGASSKKSGAVTTTTTYFLGMELTPELQRNLIIGGIALAVLIIAIVVVIIVLVKKKKAKAAATDTPAENAPSDEAAAEEAPKDEENK